MRFQTPYRYTDRKTKARYIWLKYHLILNGHILDVGADKCYLKQYLNITVEYWGIGLGGSPDQQVDLETGNIPFSDNSFDCVLCFDVLEHLENIHKIFDEVCRISKRYVIISLPNPYAAFWNMLLYGYYKPDLAMKFYGLPLEKPEDRHKWFFSQKESEEFIKYRSKKNNMEIVQMDIEDYNKASLLETFCQKVLFKKYTDFGNLHAGSLWAVLEKIPSGRFSV